MLKKMFAAATALACFGAMPAGAVPIFLQGVTPTGSGDFTFNYRAEFSEDEAIATGAKLVIFDFAGYVANSIFAPVGIDTAIEFSSGLLAFPGYTDDPNLPNLVFTYTGPLLDLSEQTFNGFGAVSIFSQTTLDGFSDLTFKVSGLPLAQQGAVGVPSGVPEPTTWGMMMLGFGALGTAMRNRARTKISFA